MSDEPASFAFSSAIMRIGNSVSCEKLMSRITPYLACLATLSLATAASGQSLEELIQQFQNEAPKVEAEVQIDAWIEPGANGDLVNEITITVLPKGETKLNADPGITVTPADQPGIDWQVPLPHRHQDLSVAYFEPPATIRLPFTGIIGHPVEVLVEYAYCLVDYQCFFGEETLRVDMKASGIAG